MTILLVRHPQGRMALPIFNGDLCGSVRQITDRMSPEALQASVWVVVEAERARDAEWPDEG